jgi:hypothetical protein
MIITCIILYIIIQYLILDYINKTEERELPVWISCFSAIFIPGLFLTTVVEILKEYRD